MNFMIRPFRGSPTQVWILVGSFLLSAQITAQSIHSHNDYDHDVPFWNAFSNGLESIEADIFLKNGVLYVTHDESDIKPHRTLESLYLKPIQQAMALQLGKSKGIQLLIDVKSEAKPTLKKLVSLLKKYPDIAQNRDITLVISGNRPPVASYVDYPSFIKFDHQSLEDLGDRALWDKVALISLNFRKISPWNGLGRLTAQDAAKVKATIEKAHRYGKPFRFWASPDTKTAWRALVDLGADFINTDMPYRCKDFVGSLDARTYVNKRSSPVYTPTYKVDQGYHEVKNIILLIGDGNGLSQISSAALANGGALTLTQLRSIGFLETASADDFTTDSAAAGTALATGNKTYNRAIGVDTAGRPLTNIPELLSRHGFLSGCITTDRLTGATPASFYAHQKDRSLVAAIASDLPKSALSLIIGAGKDDFANSESLVGFSWVEDLDGLGDSKEERVGHFLADGDLPSVLEGRGNTLAKATKNGIDFLQGRNKPFFLMVEGAKIDKFAHSNQTAGIVSEGIDFDRAVTEAIKFADASQNTLVIVTADHETSGFSIPQGNLDKGIIEGDFTTYDHTAAMVPIFAYGPYSQAFQGVYENSEVFDKIMEVLKIRP